MSKTDAGKGGYQPLSTDINKTVNTPPQYPDGKPLKLTEEMLEKALENDIPDKLWHDLRNRFTYHTPKEGQPQRYEDIRNKALNFADLICMNCPDSRERSLALTKIEEAVFWANAAIARNEK